MNSFPIHHHATMLADEVRLKCFDKALTKEIKAHMNVADLGSGTGILAALAARHAAHKVYAVEYFEDTANIARKVLDASGYYNVEVVNASSYQRPIDDKINLVVSETIGPIGPEENIVEICYEFKKRYPEVETFIPSQLSVYAMPIHSARANQIRESNISPFVNSSNFGLNFDSLKHDLDQKLGGIIFADDFSDAVNISEPVELASYKLGHDSISVFSKTLNVPPQSNAIHLYFDARLSHDVVLRSDCFSPKTHWKHSAILVPHGAKSVTLSYCNKSRSIKSEWRYL